MTSGDPILIVGGGLGGLATALALGRQGRRVRVLEQAPEFGAIGYGIQLGPNVFPMFDRLGLRQAVLSKALVPQGLSMLDAFDGNLIVRVPTGASFEQRFGNPYIVIHRIDLHNVLLDACRNVAEIELAPYAAVTGFQDSGHSIAVKTEDGINQGAALIGADGLRSVVRAQMFSEGEPRMVGYVAHRTIVPMAEVRADVLREEVVLWSGPGFHIVHYPLRGGTLFNIVAVFRTSKYLEKGDVAQYRAELKRTYRDAHPTMKALLAMMDLGRRWAISDREPRRRWSQGRVTLLGDAAHPTLQSLAQGACMAIEDGVCLAELIEQEGGAFESAFRRYEAARYLRTARLQYESRYMWDSFYHVADIEREAMRANCAERTEQDVFRCLAWLYDGFKVPEKSSVI